MFRLLSLSIALLFSLNFTYVDTVRLPAGTPLSLVLNEEIDSEKAEVGSVVEFLVKSEVIVRGQVLIRTGAIAEGTVAKVDKLCGGCHYSCPSVTIKVEQVQSVDGQRIYLKGLPHIKKAPCGSYQSAVVPIGTTLKARVLNAAKIRP
jgi:hypothetical protein